MFLWTGWSKLNNLDRITEAFVSWGIPAPHILTPFVSGVEFVGGVLLLLGLCTRIAAVPLVIVMIVAVISAKWATGRTRWRRCSASRSWPIWRCSAGSPSRARGRYRLDRLLQSWRARQA